MPSGVGAVPLNIVDGVRTGSGAGYLIPALGRANLTLLAQTRAVRLRFSGATARRRRRDRAQEARSP